jgi:Arc/MetJ-type ribon-helix-helix transcriptional regulator
MLVRMESPRQAPLTPEQIAAVQEGAGLARLEDPNTHRIYILSEQLEPTLDETYVREKLQEAQASIDRGEVADWDVDEFKADLRDRLAKKQSKP